MEIAVELRLADTSLSDRRILRFAWTEPQEERKSTPLASGPATATPTARQSSAAVNAALKRGEDLMASGDIAAARLLLRRAAESGSARGALLLANTYDPVMLEKLHVHGCSPDLTLALQWYKKAGELGSTDVQEKLKMLAKKPD